MLVRESQKKDGFDHLYILMSLISWKMSENFEREKNLERRRKLEKLKEEEMVMMMAENLISLTVPNV